MLYYTAQLVHWIMRILQQVPFNMSEDWKQESGGLSGQIICYCLGTDEDLFVMGSLFCLLCGSDQTDLAGHLVQTHYYEKTP